MLNGRESGGRFVVYENSKALLVGKISGENLQDPPTFLGLVSLELSLLSDSISWP